MNKFCVSRLIVGAWSICHAFSVLPLSDYVTAISAYVEMQPGSGFVSSIEVNVINWHYYRPVYTNNYVKICLLR
jgi:hypothetical protein